MTRNASETPRNGPRSAEQGRMSTNTRPGVNAADRQQIRPDDDQTINTFCVDCGAPDPQHQRVIEPEPPQIVELICDNCRIRDFADAWDKLTGEQRQAAIDTIDLPENMR